MRLGDKLLSGVAAVILLTVANVFAYPYEELIPGFNRTKARVMARKITKPTRANLDCAAYSANPIRFDSEKFTPKQPAKKVTVANMVFGGSLKDAVALLKQTPLTDTEKQEPIAWAPLQNLLWKELKTDALNPIMSKIVSEKWADPDVFKPYQEIAALYIHKTDTMTQLWVEVEFMPWVNFLQGVSDDDTDGIREAYGRVATESLDRTVMEKIIAWLQGPYRQNILTREQIVDWANVLASYWYPTLNTDIVDMTGYAQWPTDQTEKDVKTSLKGFKVKNPVAVIRGNPNGKPLYNVFVVEGIQAPKKDSSAGTGYASTAAATKRDTSVSVNFQQNTVRFADEIKRYGEYAEWCKKNASVVDQIKKILGSLPQGQMGIIGRDNWLFFRKSLEYIIAEDLSKQPEDKNPLTNLSAFKKYLDSKNINFLFIAVPSKEEIYYEKLGIQAPDNSFTAIISPYGRKILKDLQDAGIEVIDLLTLYLQAKKDDTKSGETLYQFHDTHWTNRGLQIAATAIADRIKSYAWYKDLENRRVSYIVKDTSFERIGDIVERLAEQDKIKFQAVKLNARQVYSPNKEPYKGAPKDPIMLIGDSFTGVFELVDCKSAGIGSAIAAKTGLPVDIITSWGGGPLIINKVLRMRKNELPDKKVLIYLMTDRDLYNYAQGWEKLKVE